jgi:glycosyltransferase involved in cell wall biosynthesis
VPEVVDHGVSGLIVGDEDEAIAAVHQIGALDRNEVRATFERRFSATTMAKAYVELYRRLPAHDTNGTSYPQAA